jgi:hypothetical protein
VELAEVICEQLVTIFGPASQREALEAEGSAGKPRFKFQVPSFMSGGMVSSQWSVTGGQYVVAIERQRRAGVPIPIEKWTEKRAINLAAGTIFLKIIGSASAADWGDASCPPGAVQITARCAESVPGFFSGWPLILLLPGDIWAIDR